MLDPSSTKVLGRRIGAAVIDFLTVSLLSLYFAKTQSEEFAITGRSADGQPMWSTADFDKIQSYAGGFNRAQEIGDTLHVFDFLDLLLITIVTALLALLLKVLIPANTGWSLGQRLLGLRVIDEAGANPPVGQHLSRMWPAIVDVLPGFLPGLVGWVIASRSQHTQRMGDRVANTYVVSRSEEPRMLKPGSRPAATELDDLPSPDAPSAGLREPAAPTLETVATGRSATPTVDVSADLPPAPAAPTVEQTPAPSLGAPAAAAGAAAAGATGAVGGLADKFRKASSKGGASAIDGLNVEGSKIEDLSAKLPDGPKVDEPKPVSPPTIETPDLPSVDMPNADVTPSPIERPNPDVPRTPLSDLVAEAPDPDATVIERPTPVGSLDATPPVVDPVAPIADATPSASPFAEAVPTPEPAAEAPAADTGTRPPPPAHRSTAERRQLFENTPAPAPQHRPAATAPSTTGPAAATAPAQPIDTPDETPQEPADPFQSEPVQSEPVRSEAATSELATTEPAASDSAAAAPPPRHRVERSNWDQPVAEDAPVWSPSDVTDSAPADPAEASAPGQAELSQAELGQAAPISEPVAQAVAEQPADATDSAADAAQSADAQTLEPQWNEEWNAWMFWDEGQQSWLRHDTDNDVWVRVEP